MSDVYASMSPAELRALQAAWELVRRALVLEATIHPTDDAVALALHVCTTRLQWIADLQAAR